MKMLTRIWTISKKEILQLTRDKVMFAIAFIAPFFLTLLFGFLYIQNSVLEVPVIVFDQDQTNLSRGIIRSFADSEKFKIVRTAENYREVKRAMDQESVYMGVIIPPHFKKDIKGGRSTEVALVLNGANLLIMNTVATAASQIIQTASAGVTLQVMQGYGIAPAKAYQAVTAVSFRTRVWYNPTLSYLSFMLLGLIGTVLQQITLLGVALSFAKERESGVWQNLCLSDLKWGEMIAGKFLVYFTIFMIDAILMYAVGIYGFGIPFRGAAGALLISMVLFMIVLTSLGMAVSILAPSVPQAIEISMLIAVPSFLISGFTWPTMSMPWFLQILSNLLPLTHFLAAVRSVVLLGNGLEVILPKLFILGIFAGVCFPLAAYGVKRKLTKGDW